MPQPQGAELAAVRARRDELKAKYLRPEDRVAALAGRLSPGGGGPGGRHLDGAAPRKRPTTDPAGGAAEEASPGADRPRPLADQRLGHALAETRIATAWLISTIITTSRCAAHTC